MNNVLGGELILLQLCVGPAKLTREKQVISQNMQNGLIQLEWVSIWLRFLLANWDQEMPSS